MNVPFIRWPIIWPAFGLAFLCLGAAAQGAPDVDNASSSAAVGLPSDVDLYIASRHGVDRDGRLALHEYRVGLDSSTRVTSSWRARAALSAVTERKLDAMSFNRLEADALYVQNDGESCGGRIGVQQVVWGGADRLQVLDVIHPLDLRESYFGDWQRKRLPLAMLNVECGIGDNAVQLLLVPQTRFNRTPSAAGRFATPSMANQLAAQNVTVLEADGPDPGRPSDWSGGVQWKTAVAGADVTLNAYRGWQGELRLRPEGRSYFSEPARFSMVGGSLARPVGPVVIRLEGAYSTGITAYVRGAAARPEPIDTDQTSYLLGVDYSSEPWFVSAQFFDRRLDSEKALMTPNRQQMVTLAVRRTLMQDRLHLTGYVAFDRVEAARYASAGARYEVAPRLLVSASVEHFSGSTKSFGLFAPDSRLMVGMEYHLR